ncbi:MAG TPA: hypothetical protein VNV43_06030 [Candidatus Acidoferrales bacterium]|nr:hypothetical protein [Candidatus Acidoferrales bacterium]
MKKLLTICLTLSLVLSARAQETGPKDLEVYYFSALAPEHLATLGGKSIYKFENTNDTPLRVQLLKIVNPRLSASAYAINGQVKYENVQGAGYLEMWSYFPPLKSGLPEGQYFSRTLGDSGEMGKITGTCDWRDFTLPFDPAGASGPPTRLEINLILPGRGTVYLTPVKLVKYSAGFSLSSVSAGSRSGSPNAPIPAEGWWSAKADPWIGGIGGTFFGCCAALIGCLAAMGKARRFVLLIAKCFIALGIILTIAGVTAVMCKQPYSVYYPLIILGCVLTFVFSANLFPISRRYNEIEIRRMTSMDATGR